MTRLSLKSPVTAIQLAWIPILVLSSLFLLFCYL